MKKATTLLVSVLFAFTMFAQQKTAVTEFYQSIIHVQDVPFSNVNQLLESTYNLTSINQLVYVSQFADNVGYTHYKYKQQYKYLEVEGSFVTVHVLNGIVKKLSGNFRSIPENISTSASISANQGLQNALNHVGATTYMWESNAQMSAPIPELVLFTIPQSNQTKLAYKMDIYATDPLYRAFVFVDAQTGKVLFENNRIHHQDVAASGNTLYNGNRSFTADNNSGTYRLRQSGQGVETYNLNNGSNYGAATDFTSSNSNNWSDATGVQAHWGAEQTHSYYFVNHNRNSFNGSGATIRSYVHYGNNYVNAFWDGSRMTYGDGDGINYSPLVSLDIVGHEITHGVTEYAANLVYSYESGALNESFSDIFGEAIEKYGTGTNDWQMGTDIGIGGSGAIRSMNNPNSFGDPDTYGGAYWYTGTGDNGGVHINSGVQNKWFYILSQGESGTNDIGNSYSVAGIGITKAANIAYRNLTVYLSSNSQYFDARAGAIQSAIDLYGAGSAEEIATTNAWYAVGVGGAYGTISYCTSNGSNSNYEWISSVSVGSFTNTSGASGYSDFTSQTVNVNAGSNYAVSLSPGFSGSVYQEYWKIWIDYNADGDFSDAGELVYSGGPSSSTVTGSISIPSTASGITRMRVSMKWNASQTECETFSYGEVEDYSIDISNGGGGGDTQPPTSPTGLVANGTTQTSTNLTWNASTDNVGVTGYDVYVDGSLDGSTASTSYTVSGLSASTSYNIHVTAKDAAGNVSGQSNTVTVTTQSAADTQAPTAPGNLSASNTTQTSTDLNWTASTDNVGVVDYDVFVDGILDGTTATTSYTINGLGANTTYNIYVKANDAAGNSSDASNTVNVTTQSSGGSQVLLGSYFETGWDGWQDGGNDCSRYSGSRSWEGSYSILIRDNSGVASSMTSPTLNLSGYNQIDIEFYFYPNSMENNEDFWLRYFDGTNWTTVGTWARGTSFNNNTFYVATVSINSSNFTFPSNAQIRFQCDASGNADRIYIDAVTVTASNSLMAITPSGPVTSIKEVGSGNSLDIQTIKDGSILYPNPASGVISIQTEDQPKHVYLMNLTGQIVMQIIDTENLSAIDVSHLPSGSYVVAIQFEDEIEYLKFIKQ